MITYSENKKFAFIDNLRFVKDNKTDYYLNRKYLIRLHRYVWEKINGKIPEGYQIHHKDHNRLNNNISNLELISRSEHMSHHSKHKVENDKEWLKRFQEAGIRKAPEWHKSEEGRKWHSIHAKNCFAKIKERVYNCLTCNNEFVNKSIQANKFCSNRCKSKYRRDSGIDNITKICEFCLKSFIKNKYAKTRFCSRRCGKKIIKN